MSHFIRKCVCGVVIAQCRCMDANKHEEVVMECVHKKSEPPKRPKANPPQQIPRGII